MPGGKAIATWLAFLGGLAVAYVAGWMTRALILEASDK